MNIGGKLISFKKLIDVSILIMLAALVLYLCYGGEGQAGAYKWQWDRLWKYFAWRNESGLLKSGLLLQGVFTTLRVGLWSMLLAALLGVLFGFMRSSKLLFFRLISGTYVSAVRNIPPLVLVFVIHFFLAMLLEKYIPWNDLRNALRGVPLAGVFLPLAQNANLGFFCSAVLALSLYEGAYITEIVRAGLESVPKGQWEAAQSLGLPRRIMLISVILPQAFRLMLPPLVSQAVSLIKDSSIVSVISVAELTYQGKELMNTTFMVFEIWLSISAIYLLISLLISGLGHIMELHIKWTV